MDVHVHVQTQKADKSSRTAAHGALIATQSIGMRLSLVVPLCTPTAHDAVDHVAKNFRVARDRD